jgi:hypothetical protein
VQVGSRRVLAGSDAVLMCQAYPRSNVAVALTRIERRSPRELAANVYRIVRPAADVAVLSLRFPIGVRARFLSGLYLHVIMADGQRRSSSMANPAQESDGVELHVRRLPGGRFSETVLARARTGDTLAIELPFGQFFLRDTQAPAVLLATGICSDQIDRRAGVAGGRPSIDAAILGRPPAGRFLHTRAHRTVAAARAVALVRAGPLQGLLLERADRIGSARGARRPPRHEGESR